MVGITPYISVERSYSRSSTGSVLRQTSTRCKKSPPRRPTQGLGLGCARDVESASRSFGYRFVYHVRGYGGQGEVDGGPRGHQGCMRNLLWLRTTGWVKG
jgi:hypothetical protein